MYVRIKKIKKYESYGQLKQLWSEIILDWMVDLPWFKKDKINGDLNKAAEIFRP